MLTETVNLPALYHLVENVERLVIKEERKKFISYAARIDEKTGSSVVHYVQLNGKGRLYAKGALSIQGFSAGIRNALAAGIYHDIDMVNCHPVFLHGICIKHGWMVPELENYVLNRESVLNAFGSRSKAKLAMLTLMYGGKTSLTSPYLDRFAREMTRVAGLMFKAFPDMPISNLKNPLFSRMSLVLQDIENTVLMAISEYLVSAGFQIGVYVFDGLMVYRNGKDVPLEDCSAYVAFKTGWKISLVEKHVD
jgi:hypothetical protein